MKTGAIKAIGVIVAAGALTLTACSDSEDATATDASTVSISAGGASVEMDDSGNIVADAGDGNSVSIDGGSISVEGNEMNLGGNAELPSDFPASLPTLDGTLQTAMSSGDSWTLVYTDVENLDEVTAELDSQFEDPYASGSGESQTFMYESDEWAITISVDSGTVTYLVAQE